MVSVAKGLESPIKLKFPFNPSLEKFSILGLGDMVVPGIFVAQCLKFDVDNFLEKNNTTNFSKFRSLYFNLSLIGYFASILMCYICMTYFEAAQPALLYLVPGLTLFSILPALILGQFKKFWSYDSTSYETKPKPQVAIENEKDEKKITQIKSEKKITNESEVVNETKGKINGNTSEKEKTG